MAQVQSHLDDKRVVLITGEWLALDLFGKGHMALGLELVLAAKLIGTALAARLFQLTQPSLLQIKWFARLYTPWKTWKDRVLAQVRSSWPWRMGHLLKVRVSVHMKIWRIRIRAALRATGL